jgi:2-dehydro-3-deoxygalactonokinase
MAETALLGVDWGSSNIRAMRISTDGRLLETRRARDGAAVGEGDYELRLMRHLGDWLITWADAPILLCGMIGSDAGWAIAPYVPAPAGLGDLARLLVRPSSSLAVRIVPGISAVTADTADVMRGEETQVFGLLAQVGQSRVRVCLPGTHTKWVDLEGGRVTGFRTYMTGELRELLLTHSLIAPGVDQGSSPEAFRRGLGAGGIGLTRSLFWARSGRLLGQLPSEHVASFVSGALIGAELAQEAMAGSEVPPLFLAASGVLAVEYSTAFADAALSHTVVDPEQLSARGLADIARRAGLMGADHG